MNEPTKYCPTQAGSFEAFEAQWKSGEDWRDVPTVRHRNGVPSPLMTGGISDAIGLLGFHQAHALAHGFAADAKASGKDIEIRVRKYRVEYDIKAKLIEEETTNQPTP